MRRKENANQKLSKWINFTYTGTEEKKPFFEGYSPNYYFNTKSEDLIETQIQDLILKGILLGKNNIEYPESTSEPIALKDLNDCLEKLNQLPPIPIEIEFGSKFGLDLLLKNMSIKKDIKDISFINGVSAYVVEDTDLKVNQIKIKYNNGSKKVIDLFKLEDK